MNKQNGQVVDLSAPLLGQRPALGAQFAAFVRRLDPFGTFEAAGLQRLPNGQQVATASRDSYLDAEELLQAFRLIVREEVAAAMAQRGE